MSGKTASVPPENTTSALSHLAIPSWRRQDGIAGTPYAENQFLIRWLAPAQKQKRFPRSVAIDIQWLLERGRKHGPAGKLRQHLEYLFRSCSGNLTAQSDLFRLTYASETLKDQGWDNYVLDAKEWKSGVAPVPSQHNGFYVEKAALSAAFAQGGRHLHSVTFRVIGDADRFMQVMAEYGLCTRQRGSTSACHTIAIEPT
uniref:DUF2913 family protein n=1 Tax=Serratia proteamaculans TaxID=28151 RepID=UPI001F4C3F4C|nr:DUF2913 family protein [Serratia proteamaculans]ULG15665.1 hypothetical protein 495p1_00056 [Serratia proteamaculans]